MYEMPVFVLALVLDNSFKNIYVGSSSYTYVRENNFILSFYTEKTLAELI